MNRRQWLRRLIRLYGRDNPMVASTIMALSPRLKWERRYLRRVYGRVPRVNRRTIEQMAALQNHAVMDGLVPRHPWAIPGAVFDADGFAVAQQSTVCLPDGTYQHTFRYL